MRLRMAEGRPAAVATAGAGATAQETGIVVYQPEAERFRINLRPSAVGISAGMIAANITHTIMDNTVTLASNTAAVGVHTVGYVAEKIAEYLGGPAVGASVMIARHAAADTARHTVRAYSPITTMIASAAVGATAAYAVTAGEAVVCKAVPAAAGAVGAAAGAVADAVSRVAGAVYGSLPSRETLHSFLPQMPRIRFNGIYIRPGTITEEPPLPPPAFGTTMRTDLISSPNYELASTVATTDDAPEASETTENITTS
jgi:hypothetical protein